MEEQIEKTARCIKIVYVSFWVFAVAFVVIGEIGGSWIGMYAACVKDIYFAESLTILLTAACVPASLKLFSWIIEKRIDRITLPSALYLYLYGYIGRLVLLGVPMLSGFLIYYFMMSTKGVLCALISLVASLFCLPGERKLRKDLRIDREEKEREL